MSVLIKGMAMPSSCIVCRLECLYRIHSSTSRSEHCPLIEIKDEGFYIEELPTDSKMEQVEDETRLTAKCLNCVNGSSYKCSKCDGEMYYKYDKDEPQKKEVEWVYNKRERLWYPYSNGELLFKDEPTTQTETQNSNLTFEKADERCKGCNHYKLTCDLFSEICRYEPKDEPQTDCAWK